ncbi:NAD(P)/FAD-dependent oxidoreductase [Gluconacetobacter sp. Hr-1-5]|uniref:NAD(P)/FAD-dependent oxidoreductase n=1 Tax=Gluconacetobacter sp. Hr-1-5 TaxID=3395370 RepID=UPI003B53049D
MKVAHVGRHGADPSLWESQNGPAPGAGRFVGQAQAEVAVVGAGVSGLSTALHLAREGRDVIVLEAADRPEGATGASAGIVTGQIVRKTPAAVLRRLGPDIGRALLQAVAESARYTFDLIRDEALDCAPMQTGFLAPFPARSARAISALAAGWTPFRNDVSLIDAETTRALTGCRGYGGALLDSSGGGIDPVAYVDSLARCVMERGGIVHRNTAVTAISQRVDGRWDLSVADGTITAKKLVLCANGGNTLLDARLANSVLPLSVCEVATPPLPADMRQWILPRQHMLTDLSTDVFSIRYDTAGRLITACTAPEQIDRIQIEKAINRRLASMLPVWRDMPLEHIWVGTAWLNTDLLPRITVLADNAIAIQACNGRGLAINTIAGREAARWASAGACGYRTLLPMRPPRSVAGFAFARHVPKLLMGAARIRRFLIPRD